jgi:hypothetical protein
MPTQEIRREEWKDFLDRFSRVHEDWLVELEVMGRELGDQPESHDLPLEGISFEDKGSGAGRIDIMVGRDPSRHATHAVDDPRRLWVQQDEQGADQALEIEGADGNRTLLRFRVAARPESLDGVMGV